MGAAELVRARRAGAALAFLSPVFATPSHPGEPALGPVRWGAMARSAGLPVAALGGVSGATARSLPRWAAGAGAIRRCSPETAPVTSLPQCFAIAMGSAALPIAGRKIARQYSAQVWLTRPMLHAMQSLQGMGRGLECPPGYRRFEEDFHA